MLVSPMKPIGILAHDANLTKQTSKKGIPGKDKSPFSNHIKPANSHLTKSNQGMELNEMEWPTSRGGQI